MTRYFFSYRDAGRYFHDHEGTELGTLEDARAEGRQSARELLGSERGENDAGFSTGVYEITNALGVLLAVVPFDDAGEAAPPPASIAGRGQLAGR